MNKKTEIKIISEIHQEDGPTVLERESLGSLEKIDNNWRLRYSGKNKAGDVGVELLVEPNELVMQREDIKGDHILMKFEPGERQEYKIIAASKQVDLISLTNRLDFSRISSGRMQLKVEYNLLSGLYLAGNYAIKVKATDL